LILNATDAMPDGGVLEITTALGGDDVELTVRDTGIGIPESAREKIFDPFYTSKGAHGTGIGLSMTYGIVSRHGGRITVESEEGHGAIFRLTFPLTTGVEPVEVAPGEPASAVRPMQCLVVDDQEAPGTALADILRRDGHRAVVTRDGREALARFHAEPFDVVFTDLAMPGLSGWQVARGVKAIAPRVPVCLVTGFGVELSSAESLTRGVDQVLTKPLSIDEIRSALARAAQMRPPIGGPPASPLGPPD
ncbi:MAG: ATP-binding protein, partial [Actinomycetota bacterium]